MALRVISNLARLTRWNVCVDQSGTQARMPLPAFSFDDFDRLGNINVYRLQKMLTAVRMFAYHTPHPQTGSSFLEYDKMTEDRYTFIGSTATHVERHFYDLLHLPKLPALQVTVSLGYVGTSSLNTVARLQNAVSGETLATNVNQVVSVDKSTRKPCLLPEWWRSKYGRDLSTTEKLVTPLLQTPQQHHSYHVTVPWSDMDRYKHTTYNAYVKYCIDAAMDATVGVYYSPHFQDDILQYPIKQLKSLYKGESVANDVLNVASWQNLEHQMMLHFDISRNNETIFQTTIEFYQPFQQSSML